MSYVEELNLAVELLSTAAPYRPDESARWADFAEAAIREPHVPGDYSICLVLWHLAERVHENTKPSEGRALFECAASLAERIAPASEQEKELLLGLTWRLCQLDLWDCSDRLRRTSYEIWLRDPGSPAARRLLHSHATDRRREGRLAEAAAIFLESLSDLRASLEETPTAADAQRAVQGAIQAAEAVAIAGNPERAYRILIHAARLLDRMSPAEASTWRDDVRVALAITAIAVSARRGVVYTSEQGVQLELHDRPDSVYPVLMHPALLGMQPTPERALINEQAFVWLRRADEFLNEMEASQQEPTPQNAAAMIQTACLRGEILFRTGEAEAAIQCLQWANDLCARYGVPHHVLANRVAPIAAEVLFSEGHFAPICKLIEEHLSVIGPDECSGTYGPLRAHLLLLRSETDLMMATSGGEPQRADHARILRALRETIRVDDTFLEANSAPISDLHRYTCLAPALKRLPRILGVLLSAGLLTGHHVPWAYNSVLRRKFRVTAQTAWEWRYASQDPDRHDLMQAARAARRELARHDVEGDADLRRFRGKRNDLLNALDEAETQLSWSIPTKFVGARARWRDVHDALPEGSLLIDYVIVTPPQASARYGAFVIGDDIRFHALGESRAIDATIRTLLKSIADEANSPAHSNAPAAARAVAEKILWPLIRGREQPSLLLISPWGKWLNRVPFPMLPMEEGAQVVDRCAVALIPSALWLLPDATLAANEPGPPFILGDPDFDLELPTERKRDLQLEQPELPGTRTEAEKLGELLGVHPAIGAGAIKKRVEDARAPIVMHIATHGFLPDAQRLPHPIATTTSHTASSIGGILIEDEDAAEALGVVTHGNAAATRAAWLNQAGAPDAQAHLALIFAGFHGWTLGLPVSEEIGDGLITASEFAALDLQGTELVVFAACSTGLGELVSTESSVMGFRRTALLAGARSTVSSLWQVRDKPTAALMQGFYAHLREGKSRAEAMRQAQIVVRSMHPDAIHWAAFVCEGQPGPVFDST